MDLISNVFKGLLAKNSNSAAWFLHLHGKSKQKRKCGEKLKFVLKWPGSWIVWPQHDLSWIGLGLKIFTAFLTWAETWSIFFFFFSPFGPNHTSMILALDRSMSSSPSLVIQDNELVRLLARWNHGLSTSFVPKIRPSYNRLTSSNRVLWFLDLCNLVIWVLLCVIELSNFLDLLNQILRSIALIKPSKQKTGVFTTIKENLVEPKTQLWLINFRVGLGQFKLEYTSLSFSLELLLKIWDSVSYTPS